MVTPLDELKNSIRTHVTVFGGPSVQLSAYLIKVIDFLDETDACRRDGEMLAMAFSLVESVAIRVHESIDGITVKRDLPQAMREKSDGLLVIVGKSRSLPDKVAAKYAVLRELAEVLKTLSEHTKIKYPDIITADGVIL